MIEVARAEAVVRRFGATTALDGVSLTVERGEVVALMGSSGSGKSTLLHCLAGLLVPDAGSVHLLDTDIGALPDRRRTHLRLERIGLVSQFGDLVPELTLRENVELPMRLLGHGRSEARRRAAELLLLLEVDDVGGRRAGEASGGQVQRAAVARALAHRPLLVLADEPTGALDTRTGDRVLTALLAAAREEAAAVVLATHEARVAAHAERLVVLRDGAVVDGEAHRGARHAAAGSSAR